MAGISSHPAVRPSWASWPAGTADAACERLVRGPIKNSAVLPVDSLQPGGSVSTVLATPLKVRGTPNKPLHRLQLTQAGAEILLPAVGATPGESFARYRQALAETAAFPQHELAVLQQVSTKPLPATRDERPAMGILVAEVNGLLDRRSTQTAIRLAKEMGCRPVLIPPCADVVMPSDPVARLNYIESMVGQLDGIIGPGGADVAPAIYGEPNTHSVNTNYRRDRFEADVALVGMRSLVAMFGICRSHQLWNAATGGLLSQSVVEDGLSSVSQWQADYGIPGARPFVLHDDEGNLLFENRVNIAPGSQMRQALWCTADVLTNSFHRQAVTQPGRDFKVVGYVTDPDTGEITIEATESWNALTTQWHPEMMVDDPLQRTLLFSVGRRAAIFKIMRDLRDQQQPITPEAVLKKMHSSGRPFLPMDFHWFRTQVVPFLAAQAASQR